MTASGKANRKPVNLALQGGGAHGAFTWGVLDYLLEDGRLEIAGVSGTSAGAMNAVALADGMMRGGPDGARESLHCFWEAVSTAARLSPLQRPIIDVLLGNWSLDRSPAYLWLDLLGRVASPYDINPLNLNPLRDLLESRIDFEKVRDCTAFRLFLSATNVETGRVKVFERKELTVDMVLASACLPFLFQAVEIDGVPYWDGGYMGNPVLFPLYDNDLPDDIVIVQINPVERKGVPKTARAILDRMNEITFNASLLRDFRAIDFVRRLLAEGKLDAGHYSDIKIHILTEEALNPLGASSKLNAEWAFLTHLRDIGRASAKGWMNRVWPDIGQRSSVDIRDYYQG